MAIHFIPLAVIFGDWSYFVLCLVQVTGLVLMIRVLRRAEYATSRWACPWIAATFLLFALVSAIVFLLRHGYPYWR
ncbi:hypothetical protein GCM10009804_15150 [Kribbella hippodromi]|uniref:Cardiolipin synthase N-terminal domain-containing protein n=1 Tax=Kribbella hippodromi TaxID=434347 RepID=A0ABN2CM74_9ACTN